MKIYYIISFSFICTSFCLSIFSNLQEQPAALGDIVTRLEKHVRALYEINEKKTNTTFDFFRTQKSVSHDLNLYHYFNYDHDLIRWCIKMMITEKKIDPLFDIWNDFMTRKGFGTEDDAKFVHECGLLIFILYNNLMLELAQKTSQHVLLADMVNLFQKVSGLPLGELLDLLDYILPELTSILQEYPLHSNQSIWTWVMENWWIPPTMIVSFIAVSIFKKI